MRGGLPKTRLRLLRGLPMFSGCSDKELLRIDGLADEIEVPAGEVLMTEGEIGTQAFIVVEGEASVTLRGQPLAMLGPGDAFGEMTLVELEPRTATVASTTPMRLLVFSKPQLNSLLAVRGVATKLLRTVAGRLRQVNEAYCGETS